jgi:hypothetical protein
MSTLSQDSLSQLSSTTINPDDYFQLPVTKPQETNRWRKGGMTFSGLKETTQAVNYMYGPGRSNIIPNPGGEGISSIGLLQTSGLGQIASGRYGPGTLLSANVSVKNPVASSDAQIGLVQSTPNKINFVNYRDTDPSLVQNLRNNPLSIYAQGEDVRNKEIPKFFADIEPDNYSNYIHEKYVDISDETKTLYVDGSPNVSILGLAEQNPFMGLGRPKPATTPRFTGRVYGGGATSSARETANFLYNQVWTSDKMGDSESFTDSHCQNKALVPFSQGYNIAPQILEGKMIVEGPGAQSNLPWGPIKVTGDPRTQQGGVWQKSGVWPTRAVANGIQNTNVAVETILPPKRFVNPYKNGLPGTLIQ